MKARRMGWWAGLLWVMALGGPSWAVAQVSASSAAAAPAALGADRGYAWAVELRQTADRLEAQATPVREELVYPGHALKRGATGEPVRALVVRLQDRGFLPVQVVPTPAVFDADVQGAVRQAQADFGIAEDGIAGAQVYANLNRDPAQTAAALRSWAGAVVVALDHAWSEGASNLVVVNIPSFQLHLLDVKTGSQRMESRVIVGMPTRRTPRYFTHIINLKYNPDWNPPPSLIARGRQYVPPGPDNPLGLLRFSTDNADNVYLHDTDEHELFDLSHRARSSGCVRVQGWHEMAEMLSNQTAEQVDARLAKGTTTYQKIARTPVWLTYSLVDQVDGRVGVYPDVYDQQSLAIGYDALDQASPVGAP